MTQPTKAPVHIMHDLETLSVESNAAVVAIGAVRMFVPANDTDRFEQYIDPISARYGNNRHTSRETMQWWEKQDPVVRNKVFSGTTPLTVALRAYTQWLAKMCGGDWDNLYLWSNGGDFDNVIFRNLAYQVTGSYPIPYRNHRCFRTLLSTAPIALKGGYSAASTVRTDKHNPLSDAIFQAHWAERMLGDEYNGAR